MQISRERIVELLLDKVKVLCDVCAGPKPSELVSPVTVEVMASEMPQVNLFAIQSRMRFCAVCGRGWDVFTRQWTELPAGIEERK